MPKMNRALKQPKVPKVTAPEQPTTPTDRVPRLGGRPEGEKSVAVRGPKQSRGSNFRDFPRLVKQMGGSAPIGGQEGPRDLDNPQVRGGRRAGPFRDSKGFVDKGALQHYFDKLRGSAERRLGELQQMSERMGDRLIRDDDDDDGASIQAGGMRIGGGGRHRERDDRDEDQTKQIPYGDDRLDSAPPQGRSFGDDRRELHPDGTYGAPPPQKFDDGPRHVQPLPQGVSQEQVDALKARIAQGDVGAIDDLIALMRGRSM